MAARSNGVWRLVVINSATVILFAFIFFKHKTGPDGRSHSTVSAGLVALLSEIYGFPLAILSILLVKRGQLTLRQERKVETETDDAYRHYAGQVSCLRGVDRYSTVQQDRR